MYNLIVASTMTMLACVAVQKHKTIIRYSTLVKDVVCCKVANVRARAQIAVKGPVRQRRTMRRLNPAPADSPGRDVS